MLPSPERQLFRQALRVAQAAPDAWREVAVLIAAALANEGYAFAKYAPLLVKAAIRTLVKGEACGEPRAIDIALPLSGGGSMLSALWTSRRLRAEVSLPPDVPSDALYRLLVNVGCALKEVQNGKG